MPSTLKLLNWNIEWKRRGTAAGEAIHDRIKGLDPDIIVLTEGEQDFLTLPGYVITADADYGYGSTRQSRRKVLLWSRHPWIDVDDIGNTALPTGRFIAGSTITPLGKLRIIGACIPWARAHVSTGQRNRKPWQDHLTYLDGLKKILHDLPKNMPCIVAGDFNQRIPRQRQPETVYAKLGDCLQPLTLCSGGVLPGLHIQSVQHVACTNHLCCLGRAGYELKVDDRPVSDHPGQLFTFTPNTK